MHALGMMSAEDILIMLGYFNARVGRREEESDVWREVQGRHGIGKCNKAGEELLEFCSMNNITTYNEHLL